MRTFFIHIIIAHIAAYYTLTGTGAPFTPLNFTGIMGGVIFVLWLSSYVYDRDCFVKVPRFFSLLAYFTKEMILANIRVAVEVLTPVHNMSPAIISMPLDARTDTEITLLANMISLTPGTLSIDLSPDKRHLYIHTVYTDKGKDETLRKIKNGFEKKLLELIR